MMVKAIRLLGIALVVVAVVSAVALFFWSGSPFVLSNLRREGSFLPLYLIGPVLVFYLVTGIGLIWRAKGDVPVPVELEN